MPTIRLTNEQRALAADHVALANWVLRRRFAHYRHDTRLWPDIQHAAYFGLCLAASRYTIHRGPFSTYAVPTIWGTVKHAIRARDRNDARLAPGAIYCVNDEQIDYRLPAPDIAVSSAEHVHLLASALRFLDPRDAAVIRLKYGLLGERPHSGREIGERLKISRERVRQLTKRGLTRLRMALLHRVQPWCWEPSL